LFVLVAKLPKNCDPNSTPDAERWLPLRERSYYRGKRKNKKRDAGLFTFCIWQRRSCLSLCRVGCNPVRAMQWKKYVMKKVQCTIIRWMTCI